MLERSRYLLLFSQLKLQPHELNQPFKCKHRTACDNSELRDAEVDSAAENDIHYTFAACAMDGSKRIDAEDVRFSSIVKFSPGF
ncbi:unnamed protein product [Arabis nemorensis]|uniref:Uncharacterized protein n=1 Tax=Arabis nemorensis TaxID=586526 RepID=A0A565BH22_9BRAS|nr:unnamed protein product [Arabis nemorensis]